MDRNLNPLAAGTAAVLPTDPGLEWYRPRIDPARLAELSGRRDLPAVLSTAAWVAAMVASATAVVLTWGSAWLVAALIAHGILACGAADARWHECGHGTAFTKERWNTVVYGLASFLLLREPTVWRWSHARHHSETIYVGRDPEIAFGRPTRLWVIALNLLHLHAGIHALWRILRHSAGRIDAEVAGYTPLSEHPRVVREARIFLGLLGAIILACALTGSILPAVVVGLPGFYGAWVVMFFGATQHAGLAQNVEDHRRSTRTVRMNPVFRFLYLNMNHHLEHHLFPSVPYHRLPDLHRELAPQLPPPLPNVWSAYREIIPTLWAQRHDTSREIRAQVPETTLAPAAPDPAPIALGEVTESTLSAGQMCMVRTVEGDKLLCRISNDDWVLADPLCTHGDARLVDGVLTDWTLECPRHNGRFDLRDGAAVRRPALTSLRVTAVEIPSRGHSPQS